MAGVDAPWSLTSATAQAVNTVALAGILGRVEADGAAVQARVVGEIRRSQSAAAVRREVGLKAAERRRARVASGADTAEAMRVAGLARALQAVSDEDQASAIRTLRRIVARNPRMQLAACVSDALTPLVRFGAKANRCDAVHVLRDFIDRVGAVGVRNLKRAAQSGLLVALCDALLPGSMFALAPPQASLLGEEFAVDAAHVLSAAIRLVCDRAAQRKGSAGACADFPGLSLSDSDAEGARSPAAAAQLPVGDMCAAIMTLLPHAAVHTLCVETLWGALELLHPDAIFGGAEEARGGASPTSRRGCVREEPVGDLRSSAAALAKADTIARAGTPAARALAMGREGGAAGVLIHFVCKAGARGAACKSSPRTRAVHACTRACRGGAAVPRH